MVQESIASIKVVKAFANEDLEERKLDRESLESVEAALRARSLKARLSPLVDLIVATGTCLVLLVGVRLVLTGRLTAGALLVFVLYLGRMYKPMKDLSKMSDTLSKAIVAFERIGELLETDRQVRRPDRVQRCPVRVCAGPTGAEWRHAAHRTRPACGAGGADRQRQIDADWLDPAAV